MSVGLGKLGVSNERTLMNEDYDFYEEDGSWMDADALASAGWGTDEDNGGHMRTMASMDGWRSRMIDISDGIWGDCPCGCTDDTEMED